MRIQRKSEASRKGETPQEDYLEQCFIDLGLSCKRHQVFCFLCLSMFTNPRAGRFPNICEHCGNDYPERRMYCMPDLVLEDPQRHGKGIIFVNGEVHDKPAVIAKDKYQISILRKNNWRIFVVDNQEIDYLKHSNRCMLALGIWVAMKDKAMYYRAFAREKEIKALQ